MNLFSEEMRRDPYPMYRQIRSSSPVFHFAPANLWMLFDHESVHRALTDHESFSSEVGASRGVDFQWLLFMDPPRHTRLRAIVSRAFTPRSVANLEPRIRELVAGLLDRALQHDEIDLVAADGVSESVARQRVATALGGDYEVITGRQLAESNSKLFGQFITFLDYALLAFAFVALLVGSFIIVNTFSIILAQRARELALLRCVGASRRQVLGMVLGEAGVVGLVASVAGLGVGVLIAFGLRACISAIGIVCGTISE